MADAIEPRLVPCDFCLDDVTGLPSGYVVLGLMLCPDCQGCKQLDEYGNPVPQKADTSKE